MALGSAPAAPSSTTSHQSFPLHGPVPVLPTQHEDIPPPAFLGGAKDWAGRCQFCLLHSDQPMKESRFHAPPRAKTASKQPLEQRDVLMAFPCLKKNYFWEGGGEEAGGGERRNGMPESVPWQEREQTLMSRCPSRVTMLKLERKQENSISVILFLFCRFRSSQEVQM